MHLLAREGYDVNDTATVDRILPSDVVTRSMLLVEQTHKTVSARELPRMIATRKNAVLSAFLPEGRAILAAAVSTSRIRMTCGVVAIVALGVAAFLSWWVACVSVLALVAARIMATKEQEFFITLAAILLGAEMLATDFAGWGKAYPDVRDRVLIAFGGPEDVGTEWLDYYLPRRNEIDAETLAAFGPTQ